MRTAPHWPHGAVEWAIVAVYTVVLVLLHMAPVRVGQDWLTLTLGAEAPLFFLFGPDLTVLAMIVSWIIGQWVTGQKFRPDRVQEKTSLLILSLAGGLLAYHLAGGQAPAAVPARLFKTQPLLPLAGPALAFFVGHFLANSAARWLLAGVREGFRKVPSRRFAWEAMSLVPGIIVAHIFLNLSRLYGFPGLLVSLVPVGLVLMVVRAVMHLALRNRQLSMISDLMLRLNQMYSADALLHELVENLTALAYATTCAVLVPDDRGVLVPRAVKGPSAEVEGRMRRVRIRAGDGTIGQAFADRRPRMRRRMKRRPDPTLDEGLRVYQENLRPYIESLLAVPIYFQEVSFGVLVLSHAETNAFSRRDAEMLQILAAQTAVGLANVERFHRTEERTLVDELTGLYNYRYFDGAIVGLCGQADRSGVPLSLLVVDLDHFKQVNDSYGHPAGNEVLRSVAQLLRQQVREQDLVCRYGGEEFTIILPGATLETAAQIAERLRRTVEQTSIPLPPAGNTTILPLRVTVSIGAASYPDTADSPQSLLRNADRAMYVGSKQAGRNRVAVYEQYGG